MKVLFENGVGAYSGKYDQVVYNSWFDGLLCYARKFRYPTLVEAHEILRDISLNWIFLTRESIGSRETEPLLRAKLSHLSIR
ncbi:MAG: hypothetical protein RBS43_04805 [Candidatus Cloacimonas sp.]|jgi:hypothetical protein|nr:hypothetical protein [Candidatus Cloacimonas sp.]